ncbi:hypothetical protein C1N83_27995 (plasmid) [Priestia aryabhattai]
MRQLNYKVFIEYNEYQNEYPVDFINKLINKGICRVKKNKIKFTATGILIYRNILIIVFPKTYSLPKNEKILEEHIQVLFEVLLKYKRESNCDSEEVDLLGGENGQNNENLITAYRLIKDFTQNGLLLKKMRVDSSAQLGNIDWIATINKRQPMFSGNSIIYTDTISRKTTANRQNTLYILHKYCVCKSIEKYGWLLGVTLKNINLDITELDFDIPYALNILKNELNSTFAEREINVIKLMREFLSGMEEQSREEKLETLATPYFQNVWELICSNNFNNQYDTLKQIIPKLNWELEITSRARVRDQRPDIIVLRESNMYIFDAKYYNINASLPGWPDVVKQLFYALTIFTNIKSTTFTLSDKDLENKLKSIKNVENIFLFPSGDKEPIKYIGKVNIENNDELNDINAYKINIFLAMKCFIGREKYAFFNQLMEVKKSNSKSIS